MQSECLRSKSLQAISAGEGVEKGNPLTLLVEMQQPLWETVWRFLKKKKKKTTGNRTVILPSNPPARHTHRGNQN